MDVGTSILDPPRTVRDPGCSERAAVTLTYDYQHSHVWLDELIVERDPHAYDSVPRHAERMSVPHGWRLDDRRVAAPARAARRLSPTPRTTAAPHHDVRRTRHGLNTIADGAPVVSLSVAEPAPRRVSSPLRSPIRPAAAAPIDVGTAVVAFAVSWVVAQLVSSLVVGALGGGDTVAEVSIGVMAAALSAAWVCYLLGMWVASDRAGTGNFIVDFGVTFHAIDAVGFGIGILSQLVVINLVYLPLRGLWPDVFTDDRLQENAKDLIDRAIGWIGGPARRAGRLRCADRRGTLLPRAPAALAARPVQRRPGRGGGGDAVRAGALPRRGVSRVCSCSR